ncbi:hypothetical protein TNCV_4859451 [Trichonephila clavipes]|nr:hypothetical protein TNCV_4859451 [Trichonephila clavipes]
MCYYPQLRNGEHLNSPAKSCFVPPSLILQGVVLRTKNWRTLERRRPAWKRLLEKAKGLSTTGKRRKVLGGSQSLGPLEPCPLRVCQVIYSQFGLAIHQNDHQARRRFVEWAQNEIAVVPDFHKRILFSNEAHFWLNGYVNKQNCRISSEANPQVYVETPLHPEKLTAWCALWAGGILLQTR